MKNKFRQNKNTNFLYIYLCDLYKKIKIFESIRPFFLLLLISFFAGISQQIYATHIRAGEITAVRVGTFTYEFTIVIYTDDDSNADSPFLEVNFDDNSGVFESQRIVKTPIGNGTSINIYTITHTFPGIGNYRVSFTEENRNEGVLNMSNSGLTPFSVETLIVIDPNFGLNSTPVLTIAPIDLGCVGNKFFHNPGAYDADGDSLSFKIVTPKKSGSEEVDGYLSPDNPNFGGLNEEGTGPTSFTIDPITGDLVWDSPGKAGEYNIAFMVEEWRNGVRIGYVIRDMQIIINNCENKRPDLSPGEVCVVANHDASDDSNLIDLDIVATDPDTGDLIEISSSEPGQGIYDPAVFQEPANFTFSGAQASPATANFTWKTGCEHVRQEPYIVVFKAEDIPNSPNETSLIDIESWLITVKGPKPQGLTATPSGRQMQLGWDDYRTQCPGFTNENFDDMEYVIWRREGCGSTFNCLDNPDMLGYEIIGTVPLSETSFTDVGPLSLGLSYSYVLTVNYPSPGNGVSIPSDEQCVYIPVDVPVITKVSVESTDSSNGQILVHWIFPPELTIDPSVTYSYNIYRAEGLDGSNFTKINPTAIPSTSTPPQITDEETFIDTGLDTENNAYIYQIELLADGAAFKISDPASSVRLTATPQENQIELNWEFNVPWSNRTDESQGVGKHLIFRKTSSTAFVQIAEIEVGTTQYIDDGKADGECLSSDETYTYYVITKGSYYNTIIPVDPLENTSQTDAAIPLDEIPPPPPILSIEAVDCSFLNEKECAIPINGSQPPIENILSWQNNMNGKTCERDIAFYRLYFKEPGVENYNTSSPIYEGTSLTFTHTDLPQINGSLSQAGCYAVTLVDRNGNESMLSNEVCQDNCIYFELPNIMTPNGDGLNDIFTPCPNPLFVKSLNFEVFNRWGNKVFDTNTITIEWDGTNNGQTLPSGIYYYNAEVEFITIDPEKEKKQLKGWIKIVR